MLGRFSRICLGKSTGGEPNYRLETKKNKQTYFGALNPQTQKTTVQQYPTGNSENTIDFLETLRSQHPGKQIVII